MGSTPIFPTMFIYYSYEDNVIDFVRNRLHHYNKITITRQEFDDGHEPNFYRWKIEAEIVDVPPIKIE